MNQLFRFIEKFTVLSLEAKDSLLINVQEESYAKNDYILKEGTYCNKVWFVKSGMIRKYFLNNGKEVTTWIHTEDQMLTSLNSYFRDMPTDEYFVAEEDTVLLSINKTNSKNLDVYPEMRKFIKVHLEAEFSALDCISKKFNIMSAKDKYELLSSEAPELLKRAKLGHIASIMGVSPETLSRIRKNI